MALSRLIEYLHTEYKEKGLLFSAFNSMEVCGLICVYLFYFGWGVRIVMVWLVIYPRLDPQQTFSDGSSGIRLGIRVQWFRVRIGLSNFSSREANEKQWSRSRGVSEGGSAFKRTHSVGLRIGVQK